MFIKPSSMRNIRTDKLEDFVLDTAIVIDRDWVYETAVRHKKFNNNHWVILEGTNSREEALAAHEKWLGVLKSGVDTLTDIFDEITYEREG